MEARDGEKRKEGIEKEREKRRSGEIGLQSRSSMSGSWEDIAYP